MSDEDFTDYQQDQEGQAPPGGDAAGEEEGGGADGATGGGEGAADGPVADGEGVTTTGHAAGANANGAASGEDGGPTLGSKINNKGEDDDRKIFVGGLHWETTAADLKEYFTKFGAVTDCTLKTDQVTGKSRGFGFVLFDEAATVDKIDPKRAQARGGAGAKAEPIKKVFVGGLSPDLPEAEIRDYFEQYGKIEEIELPFDKLKNQRRAFAFITFETEEMADKAVVNAKQKIGDKEVDIRKATPKSAQDGFGGRGGRGGMRGGGRGGYNAGGYGYYGQPAYDYSGYYGAAAQGYGGAYGYQGYGGGYDYSGYYGGQQGGDWAGYGGYAGYGAYPGQTSAGAGGAGASSGGAGGFKAKRGGGAPGYHPYSR